MQRSHSDITPIKYKQNNDSNKIQNNNELKFAVPSKHITLSNQKRNHKQNNDTFGNINDNVNITPENNHRNSLNNSNRISIIKMANYNENNGNRNYNNNFNGNNKYERVQ